jgi:glutathione S-transferase
MAMILYSHPFSTFSRRVRIALLEKSIAHELRDLDLAGKAHKQADYLALNPYGRVPTLVDGDLVIYESASILYHLETRFPEPPLLPADSRARALADMHVRLCDLQMARHTSTVIFPKRFLPPERWDRVAMDQARGEIERHLAILEPQLGDRPWLVGEQFSLVEVCYTPLVQFLPLIDVAIGPNVARWVAAMLDRSAARQTVPAK